MWFATPLSIVAIENWLNRGDSGNFDVHSMKKNNSWNYNEIDDVPLSATMVSEQMYENNRFSPRSEFSAFQSNFKKKNFD